MQRGRSLLAALVIGLVALVVSTVMPPAAAAVPPTSPPAAADEGSSDAEEAGDGLVGEQSVLLPGIPPELLPSRPQLDAAPPAPASALATQAIGDVTPSPCFVTLPGGLVDGEDVRCGFVTTPLHHDAPERGAIAIATAVIPATGPAPAADPLLILSGGPGEPLLPLLPLFADPGSPYAALAARRDVVLLDQRGTGFSQPSLQCPEVEQIATVAPEDQSSAIVAALAACHDRLVAEGKDLSAFNTLDNARDLDVVRTALGYDTWNVYGTSYGTFLALNYARLFGEEGGPLRTLTLSSAIPPEQNFILDVAPGFQQSLDRVFDACAADAGCRAAFDAPDDATGDDLRGALDRLIQRLRQNPASFGLLVPPSVAGPGGPVGTVDVTLLPETVAGALFQLFYALEAIPFVPPLVDALEEGDYEELFQLFPPVSAPVGGIALGMQLSVLCAEQVAATSAEELASSADGTSPAVRVLVEANPIVGAGVFDVCAEWDVETADPTVFEPVDGAVPALVVNGSLDHITRPEYGRQVADALPNAVLVEVPDAGHSPLLSLGACGVAIQNAFYADPGGALDDGCATGRSFAPASVVPAALPLGSRVAGADRFATAAAAAGRAFPDGAEDVVLATGANHPDALAAAGFAGALDAPILLTGGDAVPDVTATALTALGAQVVHVVGGPSAIGDGVIAELEGSLTVRRYAGATRYETAAALAEAIPDLPNGAVGEIGGLPTAIVATGRTFADALAAGPLAFAGTHPVLLVGDDVPAATVAALESLGIQQVVVLGGPAAVSPAVTSVLEAVVGGPAVRLGGATRNETAAVVAAETLQLFAADPEADQVRVGGSDPAALDTLLLARNDAFPDALAGGPLGGKGRAPILLTAPGALPAVTGAAVESVAEQVTLVRALGGSAALSDTVLGTAVERLGTPG